MKEIDKGVLEETKIIKFGGGKVEQKRKWRERERDSWREEKREKMKPEDSEGQTSSNNHFHLLNNITHFFIHMYFKKLQTTIFKLIYQTPLKFTFNPKSDQPITSQNFEFFFNLLSQFYRLTDVRIINGYCADLAVRML